MHKKKSLAERLAQLEKDEKRIDKVLVVLSREIGHLEEYAVELHNYLQSKQSESNVQVAFAQFETNDKVNKKRAQLEKSRFKRKEHMKYVA